jgi:hypothetical protein
MFNKLRHHQFIFQHFIAIVSLINVGAVPALLTQANSLSYASSTADGNASNDFPVSFVDVAERAGLTAPIVYGGIDQKKYIIETNGCGVALIDYDNDGWTDIFLLNGTRLEKSPAGKEPTSKLYHNNRDGSFEDVTAKSGLGRTGWASAVTVGDYDNDGFDDLFTTYWGRNALYHNNGNGTFTEVTSRAGLAAKGTRWGSGCAFVDYDRDGKLDLFVANYLKFDLATAPEHPRQLRTQGLAYRHQSSLSQQRGWHVHGFVRIVGHRQSARALRHDRGSD